MKRFILIFTLLAATIAVNAQYYQQSPKIAPSALGPESRSGRSVAMSSDASTIIIGAPGNTGGSGAAVICERVGSVWYQRHTIAGSDAIFGANQGYAVAISADGNTAIVGGPNDNVNVGAVWIFSRSGGVWTQMGTKLVGSGATGQAREGQSVAISGDGNTVIFGGPGDNSGLGAAWVFTRSGSIWTQQGVKLVGSGGGSNEWQGFSVSLSYDGNTAIIGAANGKNAGGYWVGAIYMFKRSGSSWTQEGHLVWSSGGIAGLGASVALSFDGNTAIAGAPLLNSAAVYVRSGSTWSSQATFSGTLPVGDAQQGESVAISTDGNTAVIGGGAYTFSTNSSNIGTGAAWVFKRIGSIWAQEGSKYVGTGAAGNSQQGAGVAISADGNTFIVGGPGDNSFGGATWVWSKTIPATSTPPVLHVSSLSANSGIKVYPNPASEELTIEFANAPTEPVVITIADAAGRTIRTRKVENGEKVFTEQIGGIMPGVYVLDVNPGNASQQKSVFVKH